MITEILMVGAGSIIIGFGGFMGGWIAHELRNLMLHSKVASNTRRIQGLEGVHGVEKRQAGKQKMEDMEGQIIAAGMEILSDPKIDNNLKKQKMLELGKFAAAQNPVMAAKLAKKFTKEIAGLF